MQFVFGNSFLAIRAEKRESGIQKRIRHNGERFLRVDPDQTAADHGVSHRVCD